MMQWHQWQWLLRPMVAAAMAVVVLNCPVAVDAAATIPSLASMAAAKKPLPPPPSIIASISNDCYCSCRRPPSLLLHSQGSTAVVVFVNGDSNGEGRCGRGNNSRGKGSEGAGDGKGGKGEGKGEGEGKG
jgi:hypothetical protein